MIWVSNIFFLVCNLPLEYSFSWLTYFITVYKLNLMKMLGTEPKLKIKYTDQDNIWCNFATSSFLISAEYVNKPK